MRMKVRGAPARAFDASAADRSVPEPRFETVDLDSEIGIGYGIALEDLNGDAGIDILSDPERHRTMAEAARRAAVERFSADAVVPRYEALYERLVGAGVGG